MEFTPPETDFLTDSYSLENGGFRKWMSFGQTKNPPFLRFYCIRLRYALLNIGILLHKTASVPFILILGVCNFFLAQQSENDSWPKLKLQKSPRCEAKCQFSMGHITTLWYCHTSAHPTIFYL